MLFEGGCVKRYAWRLFLVFCLCGIPVFLGSSDSFSLDPMFELDTKALGGKNQVGRKSSEPLPKIANNRFLRTKAQTNQRAARRPEKKPGPRDTFARKRSAGGNGPHGVPAKQRLKSWRISQSYRMSAVEGRGLQWVRNVWERILPQDGQKNTPFAVQGRNFSLSLDPGRYPVLPAADGGRILIDDTRTLSHLMKTILRQQDPGTRIVTGNPDERKRFFSSLLAAARFYSVEENFSVEFGSDPKLTVASDYKIEKTAESLLENDIVLVNLDGKRKGMPPQLLVFLGKAGFQVVETAPVISEEPDGRKMVYSIEGSSQGVIVDELCSALSVRYERDRDLLLDDGAKSGVTLSVRADRYFESNGRKVVVSCSEANPVQHTLLRLLVLKGYRVVMLNPEDDFKEISEKLLPALGVTAAFGMHPLWKQDGTPFNVHLSGFLFSESSRSGVRKILTNVHIDPLVEELARQNGFDVIVK